MKVVKLTVDAGGCWRGSKTVLIMKDAWLGGRGGVVSVEFRSVLFVLAS